MNNVFNILSEIYRLLSRIFSFISKSGYEHYNSLATETYCMIGFNKETIIHSVYCINTTTLKYFQIHKLDRPIEVLSISDNSGFCELTLSENPFAIGNIIYLETKDNVNNADGKRQVTDSSGNTIVVDALYVGDDTGYVSDVSDGIVATKTYPVSDNDDRFVTWIGGHKFPYGAYICTSDTILQKTENGDSVFEIIYEYV